MYNNREYVYANLVNGASPAITVFSGKGLLHSVVVMSPSPSLITLTDGAYPTTPIAQIVSAPVGDIQFDIVIVNGLTVLCAGTSPKILVTYSKP